MNNKIAIIGGDLRTVYLTKMLSKENTVITYGQELETEIKSDAMKIDNFRSGIEISDIILGPIPFSKDGKTVHAQFSNNKIYIEEFISCIKNKTLVAGSISEEFVKLAKENNNMVIDLMKDESLTILNTISTAEGAVEIAIKETKRVLLGSNVLILGYGRVAKVVARKFLALSCNVTCAARKQEAFAWIEADGYNKTDINQLGENLKEYDIIINTPPTMILTKERLQYLKKDCLVIDLASYPGGVDTNAIKDLNINFKWALGLPGKVAPITAAEHIKKTLDKIL